MVGDVRAKKEADGSWFDALLVKYEPLVEKAQTALVKLPSPTLNGTLVCVRARACVCVHVWVWVCF